MALAAMVAATAPLLAEDPPERSKPAPPPAPARRVPIVPGQPESGGFQVAYVEALRLLAAGDRAAALEAVIALELGDGGDLKGRDADRIQRMGRALAGRMAEVDGESLVPVMVLRHDLAHEYRNRGESALSVVAGNLALVTAGLYAEVKPTEEARALTGGLYASLGGEEQVGGSLQTARRLFEEALLFDPTSAAALLGLGAHFELLGRYDLAAANFSRLHGGHPDDVEGALRLGVNLVRLKRFGHAVPILQGCRAEGAPSWIAIIATEELARAYALSGALAEAEKLLRGGIERFPEEAALRVQLAFVLDLSRDRVAARTVIDELAAVPAGVGESPRLRYCRWPSGALEVVRANLARAAQERGEALAHVVSVLSSRGA